jgi:autotransporter-associated beta strand protein
MLHRHITFVAQNCGQILKPLGLVGLSFVAFEPKSVQAGHLFTQSSLNTPTWIQAGQGISIDQYGTEYGSGYPTSITLNFSAPSSVPAGADTTNSNWSSWSAGDVLEINLPLANATYNYTIAYDAASSGTTCAYDFCGSTTANVAAADILASDVVLPSHAGQTSTFDSTDTSFAWSIVSKAGEFSLSGYRIYTSAGTLNGTGAGLLDQSSVVSASQAQGGSGPSDISQSGQAISELVANGGSVLSSVFDGGELIIDQDLASSAVTSFSIKSGTGNAQLSVTSNTFEVGSQFADDTGFAGVLEKVGTGTLVLTNAANDYTGGTVVSAGTLQVASDDVLGAAATGITLNGGTLATTAGMSSSRTVALGASNGTVDTSSATTLTLSGVVSGTGSLTKTGAGVLSVTGTNTYTGGTTVSAGALRGAVGSLQGDIVNNASVEFAQGTDATYTDVVSGTGSLTKTGAGILSVTGTNLYTGGTTVSAGALRGAVGSLQGDIVNNASVEFAQGTDATYTDVVSGTGSLTKTGAGVLSVTGTNTYTGGTTVSAGSLDLDGSLASDVTVASTGKIEGVGSTSGDLTSSGVVAPGNSPGTLSVAGDVTFNAASNFITELDGLTYSASGGVGSYDRLAVTGAAATFTAGGTVTPVLRGISTPANNTLDPVIGDAFRVVTTANATGVSGAFSTVVDPTSGMPTNTRFDVLYGGNSVDLVLTPDDLATFAAAYGIQNMENAADAFDGIRPAQGTNGTTDKDKFFNGLYGLTASETSLALLQSSGEIHALALSDARDGWQTGLSTVRLASADADRYLWVNVSGVDLTVDQDAIGSSYDSISRNLWVGVDAYKETSYTAGIAVGVSSSDLKTLNSGSSETDTVSLAAYLKGKYGAFEYDGIVSINRSEIDTTRTVALSTGTLANTSSSTARGAALSARVGYRYDILPASISSLVWLRVDLDSTKTDTFTEEGSSVTALSMAGSKVKSTNLALGYTVSGHVSEGDFSDTTWNIGAGVSKQIDRGMPDISRVASLHGASWNVSVPKAGDVTKFAFAGFEVPFGDNADISLNLSVAERDGSLSKGASFGLFFQW